MNSFIMYYARLRRGWIKLFICNFNVYNSITIFNRFLLKSHKNSAEKYYRQNGWILMENSSWEDMNPYYTLYNYGL